MKKLLSLSFALLLACATAFAQGSGSSGGGKNDDLKGLPKVAQAMTTYLCQCFNEHGIAKLSPTSRKAIDKLVKKGADTEADLSKLLSEEELKAISTELDGLNDFETCADKAETTLAQYEGDLMQAMMDAGGDEEKFQENFQQAMVDVMKREKKVCGTFYYFFLIGMKQGGK